jgi:hypothetical protein
MNMEIKLTEMQPLTAAQYDACKASAEARIRRRLGTRPTLAQFRRELGRQWTALDVLALVVFAAAFVVSSVHIMAHMGALASAAYGNVSTSAGIQFSGELFAIAHQVGFLLLAEAAMLLFLVMHAMTRRLLSLPLILSLVAMTFVIVANWQSGIGVLESVMPPIFTIGVGFHLERLIVRGLRTRAEVQARYINALETWEAASHDATAHPDYLKMLRQEIWNKLCSLKRNAQYADAPTGFKLAAVERELARDAWAESDAAPETVAVIQSGGTAPAAPAVPFGSTAADQDGHESTPMIAHVNGNGSAYMTEREK